MKTPIEIRLSPCPAQAPRRLACKISPPYAAPLSSSSRAHVMTQVAYLVDICVFILSVYTVGRLATLPLRYKRPISCHVHQHSTVIIVFEGKVTWSVYIHK